MQLRPLGAWALTEVREVRGLLCGCPGVGVLGLVSLVLIASQKALGPCSRGLGVL